MKRFFTIFIFLLSLQNISSADSISDYEVAGLKLGKSIIEVMSIEEIIDNLVQRSEDERYMTIKYVPDKSIYSNLDFKEYYVTIDMIRNKKSISIV